MTCRYCKDKNKVVSSIAWAVYLAPLAYSAYVVLKDFGVFEKAQPYVDDVKEAAQGVYETAKDTAQDFYELVKGQESIIESADKLKDAVTETVNDAKDGNS